MSVAEAYRISPDAYDVRPVPPFVVPIAVAFHVPVDTVPRVVMFALPAQVDRAVFSTFPNPTFDAAREVIQVGSA